MYKDMTTQTIYAEHTVSITEVRKNPGKYFQETPVAVLSNNRTAGYMVSPELFEQMIKLIESRQQSATSRFRPSHARLEEIAKQGEELLLAAYEEDLKQFEI